MYTDRLVVLEGNLGCLPVETPAVNDCLLKDSRLIKVLLSFLMKSLYICITVLEVFIFSHVMNVYSKVIIFILFTVFFLYYDILRY